MLLFSPDFEALFSYRSNKFSISRIKWKTKERFFFFQVLARLWWLLHLSNLFLFYFGLIGFIFLVLSDGSIKSAYYLWAIFFFSLKSHFLCGVSTCQADWCILIVDRLNFSFLITAVFSVLSLDFFLNLIWMYLYCDPITDCHLWKVY